MPRRMHRSATLALLLLFVCAAHLSAQTGAVGDIFDKLRRRMITDQPLRLSLAHVATVSPKPAEQRSSD